MTPARRTAGSPPPDGGRLSLLHWRCFVRRPSRTLLIALLSLLPMGYWAAQLLGDLRADMKELLPEAARSVRTLRTLEQRFGGWAELAILVESPDRAANRRFSDDLVAALSEPGLLRSVRNKTGPELSFFEQRRFLFADLADLQLILGRIEGAVADAKARANPMFVDLDDAPPVRLDLADVEAKYAARLATMRQFPDRYYENATGSQLAIVARKHGFAFGVADNQRLVDAVQAAIGRLDPRRYHPQMSARVGGDVKNVVEEQASLTSDVALSSVVTFLLLGLVVAAYYRCLRALPLVAFPVAVGLVWTFGISHFLVGYLIGSSAFLGPIVAGNGINFGLILLARYFEERRRGLAVDRSLAVAVAHTARATSTASLAAAIAYGSLMLTDFRGFRHFGLIAGLGMVVCWLATFALLPPLVAWWEARWPLAIRPRHPRGGLATLPLRLIERSPRGVAWAGLATAVVALVATAAFLRDPYEKDFEKLLSTDSRTSGSALVERQVEAIFDRHSGPQVILVDSLADVRPVVDHLTRAIHEGGAGAPISEVVAMDSLVPDDQVRKIAVLRQIRAALSDDLLAHLDPAQRRLVERHRPPADLAPFTAADLPESIRADFRELDGREGLVVLALPNRKLNLFHADEIGRVADVLRAIPVPGGRVVESSGNFVIYADMVRAIASDGPRASACSLAGVLLLCAIAYSRRGGGGTAAPVGSLRRRLLAVAPVAGPLLVGVAWLGALLYVAALKLNFLNFIALPITFGVGADYAVNVYSRYRLERRQGSSAEAVRRTVGATGGAVGLCSLTTIIGYGSLLFAHNGALNSFGKVAILGELCCLTAALVLLPAWLLARPRLAVAAAMAPSTIA